MRGLAYVQSLPFPLWTKGLTQREKGARSMWLGLIQGILLEMLLKCSKLQQLQMRAEKMVKILRSWQRQGDLNAQLTVA